MSFATSWLSNLYPAQTALTGFAYTATIGAVVNKVCVATELSYDEIIIHGGEGEKGGYELQMLETDVPAPVKYQAVTLKRDGTDFVTGLKVLNFKRNNGVLYVFVGDPAATA